MERDLENPKPPNINRIITIIFIATVLVAFAGYFLYLQNHCFSPADNWFSDGTGYWWQFWDYKCP